MTHCNWYKIAIPFYPYNEHSILEMSPLDWIIDNIPAVMRHMFLWKCHAQAQISPFQFNYKNITHVSIFDLAYNWIDP